jgi:hypothetical protein
MGIPGFFGTFITNNVRQAVVNGLPQLVSSLAFDLNGVYHDARKQVLGDGPKDPRIAQALANTDPMQLELEIHNAITGIILRMVQAAQPRDCLILAVDGVAPGAKMQQQKGRRERAALESSPLEAFDRNAITPGTDFMIRLDNFMVRFIGSYRQYLPPKVIYSSHLVPGEGEHKIMDFYRRGEVSTQGGAHVLYGLDADLIMLSLLSPVSNIYLSRETVQETVKIDSIREYLLHRSGNRISSIDDFVVMMFLIGNDFLPHSPALEEMSQSINILLDIYSDGDYVLTVDGDINWTDMHRFIVAVASRENELLAALSVREVKYPSRFLRAALINNQFYPENFRSAWYQNALGPKGPQEFTNTLLRILNNQTVSEISRVTPERIQQMVVDYMRTMSWIYLYYSEGTNAINHDWAYPYYHTPMLMDIAAVMATQPDIFGYEAYDGMVPFTALHQLVAVLPLKSKDLLPQELHPLFGNNSVIRDLYPDNFIIERDGKNKDHEGTPIVPLIDRRRILEAVAQITFTPERAKIWIPAEDQFFVRTEEENAILRRHQDYIQRQQVRNQQRRGRGGRQQYPPRQQQQQQPRTEQGGQRGRGRGGKQQYPPRQPYQQQQQPQQQRYQPQQQQQQQQPPQQQRYQQQQPPQQQRYQPPRQEAKTTGIVRGNRAGPGEIRRSPAKTAPQTQVTPTTAPLGMFIGKGAPQPQRQQQTVPVMPTQQPQVVPIIPTQQQQQQQQPRSPAQWNAMKPLM